MTRIKRAPLKTIQIHRIHRLRTSTARANESIRTSEAELREGLSEAFPPEFDGFVKSPSAALRGNFVAAAHLNVRLTPQFLRAKSRLWRESFLRNHYL
jgi:hypothetical protein